MHQDSRFHSRRELFVLGASLSATALPASAVNPQPRLRRDSLDTNNPSSVLQACRKVLFAQHEDLVCWWMKGTKYGLVDNRATPFYGMEIATFLRCRDLSADHFEVNSLEIVYYTDLATGKLLQRWQNPYTSEWLDMKYVPMGPTRVPYSVDGPEMPRSLPGVKIDSQHRLGPPLAVGDDVWIRNDSDASVTRDSGGDGKPFLVHDWATYHASLRDIEDPAIKSAPADVSFIDLTSWPANFKMGDRVGTRMSRATGRKVDRRDAMPQSFLSLLQQQHPDIYRDPIKALESAPNRFER